MSELAVVLLMAIWNKGAGLGMQSGLAAYYTRNTPLSIESLHVTSST